MEFTREKQVAIKAVSQAAQLCRLVQAGMVTVDSLQKQDKSPVTVADFGAQALVCRQLLLNFPQDPIVAEEDSAALQAPENQSKLAQVTRYVQQCQPEAESKSICHWIDAGNGTVAERFWTLDPIDGTKGFLRNGQYAVALALIVEGQVQVAALACPALSWQNNKVAGQGGVVFVAVRGAGATISTLENLAFAPIQVTQSPQKERFRFVESVEAAHGNQDLQQSIAQVVGITRPPLRMDSQAKYGAVARGDAVLYLRLPSEKYPNYREKIWDHAAGSLIIEEAGGRVTDMNGQSLDFSSDFKMHHNRGVVASNGTIHAAVLEALAQALG